MSLTPEQRYRQAIIKARIIARREMDEFMAGKRDWLECSTDRERLFVIAEIGRAFEAGRASILHHHSPSAATIGDTPSEPRPPASAAMGHSAEGEASSPISSRNRA